MSNILKSKDADAINQRVHSIQPDLIPLWGKLSVTQMLFHTATVNDAILKAKISTRKPLLKQTLLRILVLDILQKLPKGIKGNPEFFNNHSNLIFENEKARLLNTFNSFSDKALIMGGEHPVFGKLSHVDWGRFVWIHLDHHFRQFNC
jgi:hypothetical protein